MRDSLERVSTPMARRRALRAYASGLTRAMIANGRPSGSLKNAIHSSVPSGVLMDNERRAGEVDASRIELIVCALDVGNKQIEYGFPARLWRFLRQEQPHSSTGEEREFAKRIDAADREGRRTQPPRS